MDNFATTIALIGIVIVVASLLSGALERSGLPIVAVFLALGAGLGPWGLGLIDVGFHSPTLRVLSMLALALVLFSDAVTIELTDVRSRRRLLWRLLGPGTLIPAVVVAVAARTLLDVSWSAAAILGAALASTDPVILRSVLRSRALPTTAQVALRIETGANDVVLLPVVVIAMLSVGYTAHGPAPDSGVTRSILGLFVLGPLLGGLVGWIGIRMLSKIRSTLGVRRDYEAMYALGLAFTGFATAEAVGGSGFLAAFAAGFMVGSQDVELCDCFLEYGEATAEMLLLLTFVALGMSLIWSGLTVITPATLAFAAIALVARTVVLLPVLRGTGVPVRDRRLIALFGPRGLSSLLLVLLPVFAGVPGAPFLFAVTSLVVIMSVIVHGGGIALYMRGHASPDVEIATKLPAPGAAERDTERVPALVTLTELADLERRGEEIIFVDARRFRHFNEGERQITGAVRVDPNDAVRDAVAQRLSQRATLVVYCA
jgi:NhaP-type Na+/H+ or K+/H+ antiporter